MNGGYRRVDLSVATSVSLSCWSVGVSDSIGKLSLWLAADVISAAAFLVKFKGSVLTRFGFLTKFPCCHKGLT